MKAIALRKGRLSFVMFIWSWPVAFLFLKLLMYSTHSVLETSFYSFVLMAFMVVFMWFELFELASENNLSEWLANASIFFVTATCYVLTDVLEELWLAFVGFHLFPFIIDGRLGQHF